MGHRQAL